MSGPGSRRPVLIQCTLFSYISEIILVNVQTPISRLVLIKNYINFSTTQNEFFVSNRTLILLLYHKLLRKPGSYAFLYKIRVIINVTRTFLLSLTNRRSL